MAEFISWNNAQIWSGNAGIKLHAVKWETVFRRKTLAGCDCYIVFHGQAGNTLHHVKVSRKSYSTKKQAVFCIYLHTTGRPFSSSSIAAFPFCEKNVKTNLGPYSVKSTDDFGRRFLGPSVDFSPARIKVASVIHCIDNPSSLHVFWIKLSLKVYVRHIGLC